MILLLRSKYSVGLEPEVQINTDIRFDYVNKFISEAGKQSKCEICKTKSHLYWEKCAVMICAAIICTVNVQ